jgi:hypothetical protein
MDKITFKLICKISQCQFMGDLEKFHSDASRLWEKKEYTDFDVVCKSEKFACHRAILSSRSSVFAAMLSMEGMDESVGNKVSRSTYSIILLYDDWYYTTIQLGTYLHIF